MTVRATWKSALLAESDDTILVEGNHYFPPGDVVAAVLERSDTTTHCPWKGDARYYSVVVDGEENTDAAWYYPDPFAAASAIRNYVAFWRGVEVSGDNPGEREIGPPAR